MAPPSLTPTEMRNAVARLGREGCIPRHGGDHDVYKHASKPGRVVVARDRTLSIKVARMIAKAAG